MRASPTKSTAATSTKPFIELPQVQATYRFLPANNSWGYVAEVLMEGQVAWQPTDMVPVSTLAPLFIRAGLIRDNMRGNTASGTQHAISGSGNSTIGSRISGGSAI